MHDEKTFFSKFLTDLENSQNEVIIESPFITIGRMKTFWPLFRRLVARGVKVYIVTRDPHEHTDGYDEQSEVEIQEFEAIGIQVLLCTGNHHRKLAIIDRNILWEGSLNILSQAKSREFMRRLEDGGFAVDLFNFIGYGKYI
ncbi:MAG: phospholipase D-like domain-containing protein [Candidatus Paceibacterota bacterium]